MDIGTLAVAIFLGAMGMFAGTAALYLTRQRASEPATTTTTEAGPVKSSGEYSPPEKRTGKDGNPLKENLSKDGLGER